MTASMDQSEFENNNTQNCCIESSIPECLKSEPCWLGIDEAGRGPVLGPMVYGICFSPISKKEKFIEMGFADSKTLSEEAREEIFDRMCKTEDLLGWMVEILSPTYISNSMLKRCKYSLNAVSHDSAIGLVKRALAKGVNVTEVYVDTVGPPEKYQEKLKGIFPEIDITVSKKADAIYPIVSAASICAKVARDKAVKNWKFLEGISEDLQYGSGYPNDPLTKRFLTDTLDKVFGFPQFVRFSWSTAAQIMEKEGYKVEWEDYEEEDTKGTPALTSFFNKKGDNKAPRHRFFTDRNLVSVTHL